MPASKAQRTAKKTKPNKPAKAAAKTRAATQSAAKPAGRGKAAAKADRADVRKGARKKGAAIPVTAARVVAKSATAKTAPANKAPAKATFAKATPAKATPAKKAPTKKAPTKKAPTKKAPTKKAPTKKTLDSQVATKSVAAKPAPKSSSKKLTPKTQGDAKARKSSSTVGQQKSAANAKKVGTQLELADWASAPPKADSTTPARDARQLLEQRKAIKSALAPSGDGKAIVDSYMRDVDHPFKAEMEAVRQIILGVSPKLSERIKWNAPSFYYKVDLGAFNPRSSEFAHLILLFPDGGALPEKSSILEGTHKDRREVKFHSMDDVKSKQRALEKIIKDWVEYRDR